MDVLERSTSLSATLESIRAWIRKPVIKPTDAPGIDAAEILRIAETSPHLLLDIGFLEFPPPSENDGRVFLRGPLRIHVSSDGRVTLVCNGLLE